MAEARVVRPDRRQLRWDMIDLEGLLPADHRARLVWSFVESLDLSQLYDQVLSREGEAGRPAADPAVLLSLWLYATIEGVGSARELERLAQSDAAYRWLAGGVPLNYHGLADFRVDSVEVLDRLLTQSVTALIAEGLVSLGSRSQSTARRFAPAPARSRSGRAKNCSRSKRRSPSVWPPSSRSFRAIRGLRRVEGKPRGSGRRARFRSAPEERGRRSNGLRRSASRAPRSTPRTRPKRRCPGLRRPTPRRASCAFPTAPFAPPTMLRSPRRRRKASLSRSS
jgi:transposase